MAAKSLVVFDIETIPDAANHSGSGFPKPPFHIPVAIAFLKAEIGVRDDGDPNLVFHSFRHTFITAARSARVDEEVRDKLVGHAPANVGRGYGDISLEVLAEAVGSVKYRGLEAVAAKDEAAG